MVAYRKTNVFDDVDDPLVQAFEMLKQREEQDEVNLFESIFNPIFGMPVRSHHADSQD